MSEIDMQALQPPVSKTCQHGTITGTKREHAACTNRECGCYCHESKHNFAKSWKRP